MGFSGTEFTKVVSMPSFTFDILLTWNLTFLRFCFLTSFLLGIWHYLRFCFLRFSFPSKGQRQHNWHLSYFYTYFFLHADDMNIFLKVYVRNMSTSLLDLRFDYGTDIHLVYFKLGLLSRIWLSYTPDSHNSFLPYLTYNISQKSWMSGPWFWAEKNLVGFQHEEATKWKVSSMI